MVRARCRCVFTDPTEMPSVDGHLGLGEAGEVVEGDALPLAVGEVGHRDGDAV